MKRLLVTALACALPLTAYSAVINSSLDDILTTDSLGYECVNEDDLEIAFTVGKGVRAPQVCVSDPCADMDFQTLSREIIGTDPSSLEFDAFLRRQDEVCGGPQRAQFTDAEVRKFAFSGTPATALTPVPLPNSLSLLFAALGFAGLLTRRKGRKT